MRVIPFEALSGTDFSVFSLVCFYQQWYEGKSYVMPKSGRPDNGISFFFGCSCDYICDGTKENTVHKGGVSYLPAGKVYTARFFDAPSASDKTREKHVTNYLINFKLMDAFGEPFVLSDKISAWKMADPNLTSEKFSEIMRLSFTMGYPPALVNAKLTELLLELFGAPRAGDDSFDRAFDYISVNCLNGTITVAELAALCHMSESTFRRGFHSRTGISPKRYIEEQKIEKATVMLHSGSSVADAALSLGFADSAYFSRFFKKMTGKVPSEIS